jgi:RNA polymerase sigma factor (sigma-70 family)
MTCNLARVTSGATRATIQVMSTHDAALVQRARAGDRGACSILFERHWDLLLSLCIRALGDADLARDAAQEATIQALLSLDRLRRSESFGSWLGGIGLNVCRSWLRYRPRDAWSWEAIQGGRLADEPLDWRPDPAELAEAADLSAQVCRAVADLPAGQRAAVLLFYLSGLTYAETAAELGIEVGAVKTRLHKARATLRRDLDALWADTSCWKETTMAPVEHTDTADQAIAMQVVDVRRVPASDGKPPRHAVILEEVGGERSLLFFVGGFEGWSLAALLEKVETKRPMTYAFLGSILEASGATLRETRIVRLLDESFYAVAVIEGANGTREIDARPSDAVSLALLTGAPILVSPAVLSAVVDKAQATERSSTAEQIARVRAHSEGAAEIVASMREQWPPTAL